MQNKKSKSKRTLELLQCFMVLQGGKYNEIKVVVSNSESLRLQLFKSLVKKGFLVDSNDLLEPDSINFYITPAGKTKFYELLNKFTDNFEKRSNNVVKMLTASEKGISSENAVLCIGEFYLSRCSIFEEKINIYHKSGEGGQFELKEFANIVKQFYIDNF